MTLVRARGAVGHKQMMRIASDHPSQDSVYCAYDDETIHRAAWDGSSWSAGKFGDLGFCGADLEHALMRLGKNLRNYSNQDRVAWLDSATK